MRIGIMTFWESQDNYGQILQCYALQKFLQNKGHDAFLIRYRKKIEPISLLKRICALMVDLIRKPDYFHQRKMMKRFKELNDIQVQENKKHPRFFDSFKGKNIRATPVVYNQHDLYGTPPDAEVFIAGSDQIWSTPDDGFFLSFVPNNKIKIAYAASGLPRSAGKEFIPLMSNFDIITVREDITVDICTKLGIDNVQVVPDPTLLLTGDDYSFDQDNSENKASVTPYVFIYMLGNSTSYDIEEIYSWAKSKNLDVKLVASNGYCDGHTKCYPKIEDWISLIRNAKYIFTNSFHGMVFSILLHKQFMVIPLSNEFGGMNARLTTTLGSIGLESRILNSSLDMIDSEINYREVDNILTEQRNFISNRFDEWLNIKSINGK